MKKQTMKKQLRVQTQVRAGADRCEICKLSCLFEPRDENRERCNNSCNQTACRK